MSRVMKKENDLYNQKNEVMLLIVFFVDSKRRALLVHTGKLIVINDADVDDDGDIDDITSYTCHTRSTFTKSQTLRLESHLHQENCYSSPSEAKEECFASTLSTTLRGQCLTADKSP